MEFKNKYQNPYVTLLCKNYDGYKNMIKILSDAHVNSDNCSLQLQSINYQNLASI